MKTYWTGRGEGATVNELALIIARYEIKVRTAAENIQILMKAKGLAYRTNLGIRPDKAVELYDFDRISAAE